MDIPGVVDGQIREGSIGRAEGAVLGLTPKDFDCGDSTRSDTCVALLDLLDKFICTFCLDEQHSSQSSCWGGHFRVDWSTGERDPLEEVALRLLKDGLDHSLAGLGEVGGLGALKGAAMVFLLGAVT